MTDPGDMSVNFYDPQFTITEAARVADIPAGTIRNWKDRGTVEVGTRHFTGRWMLSGFDVLRLTVMGQLTAFSVDPRVAAGIANHAVTTMEQVLEHDENGELMVRKGAKYRPNVNLLVAFKDGGAHMMAVDINAPGEYYPPTEEAADKDATLKLYRRAHVVVPLYSIFGDVLVALGNILAEDR